MRIKLKLFAQLKDVLKTDEIEIDLRENATVGELKEVIKKQIPELGEFMASVSFAVDDEYVGAGKTLNQGATVAVIPPISGG
jgi:molybdopterin converting factor subunit 1